MMLKRIGAVVLSVSLIIGFIAPVKVEASDSKFDVSLTKTSGDILSGYYVEYTINGLKYRSDEVGQKINQIAFDHMSDSDKRKVLGVFAYQPKIRWNQFGKEFSQDMADWYNDVSGWTEAQKILSNRLAAKNFPEYQQRFSDSGAYFDEYFKPKCIDQITNMYDYPEIQQLYKEEQLVFSWACEAYNAMVRANDLKTSVAMKSLSGDLIQLITDKCLVPRITMSGTGGVATEISTTIFDYVNSITGMTDDLQDMVVGRRVRASDATTVMTRMAETIDFNEKIIKDCLKRCHEIQSEIETKYPELVEKKKKVEEERVKQEKENAESIIEASPEIVSDKTIKKTNEDYDARLSELYKKMNNENISYDERQKAQSDYNTVSTQKTEYNQRCLDAKVNSIENWIKKYTGDVDYTKYSSSSIIGSYIESEPEWPGYDIYNESAQYFLSTENLPLSWTEEEVSDAEEGLNQFLEDMKAYMDARMARAKQAKENGIAARNEYFSIVKDLGEIEKYNLTISEEAETILKNVEKGYYINTIDAYCGALRFEGDTVGELQEKLKWMYFDETDYESVKEYHMDGKQADWELQKKGWEQYQKGLEEEAKTYASCEKGYREAWDDYLSLYDEEKELLDGLPDYIKEQVIYNNTLYINWDSVLGKSYASDDKESIQRITAETNEKYKKYVNIEVKMSVAENEIRAYGSALDTYYNLFYGGLFNGENEYNKNLTRWDDRNNGGLKYLNDETGKYNFSKYTLNYEEADNKELLKAVYKEVNGITYAQEKALELCASIADNNTSLKSNDSMAYNSLVSEIQTLSPSTNSYYGYYVSEKQPETSVEGEADPLTDMLVNAVKEISNERAELGLETSDIDSWVNEMSQEDNQDDKGQGGGVPSELDGKGQGGDIPGKLDDKAKNKDVPSMLNDKEQGKDSSETPTDTSSTTAGNVEVTSIVDSAYAGNTTITEITIPDTVEEIGDNAFSGCSGIKNMTIPANVKTIGKNAFAGCSNIKTVTIKTTTITKISQGTFKDCRNLVKITIPANVKTIGKDAFSGDKKLKTIIIKSTKIKSIGKNAFKNVPKNATIKLPKLSKKQKKAYKKMIKKAGFKGKIK